MLKISIPGIIFVKIFTVIFQATIKEETSFFVCLSKGGRLGRDLDALP